MRYLQLPVCFILILFTSVTTSLCQVNTKPLRIEFTVAEDNQPYKILPLENNGVLLFYRAVAVNEKKENRWILGLFDSNLKQTWTREFPLPEEFEYKFIREYKDTIFLGFQDSGKKGSNKRASVILVDVKTGFLKMDEETLPDKNELLKGELINGYLILGMKDKNEHTTILIRNLSGSYRTSISLESRGRTYLEDIKDLPTKNGFMVMYEDFKARKESAFQLRSYDFTGKQISAFEINLQAEESTVNTIKTFPLDSGKQLILGAYSNQKNKTFTETENRIEESTGFFGGMMVNLAFNNHYLYNFLDFKNFFNRVRGNQSVYEGKNLKKDKEISSDYRLLLHDIVRRQNEYILLGEAYYPEYHTITNWTYDYYGHMVPNSYSVFDGYRYNNAFICAFDSSGKMLWENSMEISNLLTMNLKPRVNMIFDNQEIILSYLTDGKIASKVINKDQTIDGIEYASLENSDPHDKVIDNTDGILVHWYNNYMIAYGYQDIKNLTRSDTRRSVFYINKIVFR